MPGPKMSPEEARRLGIPIPQGIKNVIQHGSPEYDAMTPQQQDEILKSGPTHHYMPPSPVEKVPQIKSMLERSPGLSEPGGEIGPLSDRDIDRNRPEYKPYGGLGVDPMQATRSKDASQMSEEEIEQLDRQDLRTTDDQTLNEILDEYDQLDPNNPENRNAIKHQQLILDELEEREAKRRAFPKIKQYMNGGEDEGR